MSYTATTEWDGYNWVAEIDEIPGALTQAKRLDLIPGRLVEVLKLVTGKRVSEKDIRLDLNDEGEGAELAAEVRALRADVQRLETVLNEKTPVAIRKLRKRGMSLRDVGALTGVSYQRVHQLLTASPTARRKR
jgi:predicted RNase H-like HicB family nuclease